MSIKDRYNEIITTLEEIAQDRDAKVTADTAYTVATKFGMDARDLNAVIRFLLGKTVIEYVKDRKLVAAYKHIISSKRLDIEEAIEISGFDNHSSFDKRFKQYFGLSPKEAFHSKDQSLYEKLMTWDLLSQDMNDFSLDGKEEAQMTEKTIYGIPEEQYTKMVEATELQTLYGLDAMYGQIGFDLAESLSISLKEAFEFMDSVHAYFEELSEMRKQIWSTDETEEKEECESTENHDNEDDVRDIAFDPFYHFMFFECKLSVSLAELTALRIGLPFKDIMKLDPQMVLEFAVLRDETEINFDYFRKAYEFYMANITEEYGEDDLDEFLDGVCCGLPIEEAFADLIPSGWIDDLDELSRDFELESLYEDSEEGRQDMLLDGLIHEEDLCGGERFDFEYDEENYDYDLDDQIGTDPLDF